MSNVLYITCNAQWRQAHPRETLSWWRWCRYRQFLPPRLTSDRWMPLAIRILLSKSSPYKQAKCFIAKNMHTSYREHWSLPNENHAKTLVSETNVLFSSFLHIKGFPNPPLGSCWWSWQKPLWEVLLSQPRLKSSKTFEAQRTSNGCVRKELLVDSIMWIKC